MQIYWNKRERLHKKRVQLPPDWFGTPTWPPFHCFGTPILPPWRHVKTLYWHFPTPPLVFSSFRGETSGGVAKCPLVSAQVCLWSCQRQETPGRLHSTVVIWRTGPDSTETDLKLFVGSNVSIIAYLLFSFCVGNKSSTWTPVIFLWTCQLQPATIWIVWCQV